MIWPAHQIFVLIVHVCASSEISDEPVHIRRLASLCCSLIPSIKVDEGSGQISNQSTCVLFMGHSEESGQMPHNASSDLRLFCLHMLGCSTSCVDRAPTTVHLQKTSSTASCVRRFCRKLPVFHEFVVKCEPCPVWYPHSKAY